MIVTGVSKRACWIRVLEPPVEGRLVHDGKGLSVGKRLRAQLGNAGLQALNGISQVA